MKHDRIMYLQHQVFGLLRETVRKGIWGVAAFFAYKIAGVLAGKTTVLDSNVMWVLRLGANKYFLLSLVGLSGGAYYGERRLRKRTIRGMSSQLHLVKDRVDPDRSSSDLTADGTPRPEDLDDA